MEKMMMVEMSFNHTRALFYRLLNTLDKWHKIHTNSTENNFQLHLKSSFTLINRGKIGLKGHFRELHSSFIALFWVFFGFF